MLEAFQRIRATHAERAADHRAAQARAVRRGRAAGAARRAGTSRAAASCASTPSRAHDVVVLDTIGELAQLYRSPRWCSSAAASSTPAATISSSRRCSASRSSLVRTCRTSPRSRATFLDNGAAIQVADGRELEPALLELLGDPVRRASLGAAARALVEANRGARGKSLAAHRAAAAAASIAGKRAAVPGRALIDR